MARHYNIVMKKDGIKKMTRYKTLNSAMRHADRYLDRGYECVLIEVNESGSGKVNTREHGLKR
jgi:hypothetical protein